MLDIAKIVNVFKAVKFMLISLIKEQIYINWIDEYRKVPIGVNMTSLTGLNLNVLPELTISHIDFGQNIYELIVTALQKKKYLTLMHILISKKQFIGKYFLSETVVHPQISNINDSQYLKWGSFDSF